jgi:hypothetical protein
VLLAGCGTADHDDAVAAVQRYVATHLREAADAPRVHCTSGVGTPYRLRSPDFLCLAHRSDVRCDELRATRRDGVWHVTVYRRDVDCVLPA